MQLFPTVPRLTRLLPNRNNSGGGSPAPPPPPPLPTVFYAAYNGATPYNTDFTGNDNSYNGITPTQTIGGAIFRPGKFGKARQIADATENLVINPVGNDLTAWVSSDDTSLTLAAIPSTSAQFGNNVFRAEAQAGISAGTTTIYQAHSHTTINSGSDYAFSFFARGSGEWSPAVHDGTTYEETTITLTSEWQRIIIYISPGAAELYLNPARASANTSASDYMEYDGVQLEEKSYITPFHYGDMPGGSWSGTPHNSTSTRSPQSLRYDGTVLDHSAGTISACFYRHSEVNFQNYFYIYTGSTDRIFVIHNSNLTRVYKRNSGGGTYVINGSPIPERTWTKITITWTETETKLYLNGVQSGGTWSGNLFDGITGNHLYIGGISTQTPLNGFVDEFCIWSAALTEAQIADIYNSNAPYSPGTGYG